MNLNKFSSVHFQIRPPSITLLQFVLCGSVELLFGLDGNAQWSVLTVLLVPSEEGYGNPLRLSGGIPWFTACVFLGRLKEKHQNTYQHPDTLIFQNKFFVSFLMFQCTHVPQLRSHPLITNLLRSDKTFKITPIYQCMQALLLLDQNIFAMFQI